MSLQNAVLVASVTQLVGEGGAVREAAAAGQGLRGPITLGAGGAADACCARMARDGA